MSITLDGTNGITTPDVESSGPISGTNGTFTGNVGIGTSSPSAKLDVNGNAMVRGVGGGEGGQIDIFNPNGTTQGLYIDVASANTGRIFQTENNSVLSLGQLAGTGGVIIFYTSAAERLRIADTGAFGIGGTNYGTSGQVLTSGGSGASPSWTSAALGSTTVTNKTGSRATATTYQNTTNGWLLVCFSMSNNGVTFLIGATSGLGITAMSSNFSGNVQTYLVPPGWYYRATGTVLSNWTEGQA